MSTNNSTSNIFALATSSTPGSSSNAPEANTSAPSLFSNTANSASQSAKPSPNFGLTSGLGSDNAAAPTSSSPFGTSFATLAGPAPVKSPFASVPAGNLYGTGTGTPKPPTITSGESQLSLYGSKSTTAGTDAVSSLDKQTAGPGSSLFAAYPPSMFAQKKNEGDLLTAKLTFGEVAKDPKTVDKGDADAPKHDNKIGSVFSLGVPRASFSTNDGQASSATGSTTAIASSTAVPAPSTLRGKTVDDIVNRWSSDLEIQARAFSQFASEVAVWDRALVENGDYIAALYAAVIQAESTQTSLDQTLEHVEQQQRQLVSTLDQYEKIASEILHGSAGIMTSTEGLGLADSERDKSYALAANLYTQLDDLSNSLTQMVEAVNGLNISSVPKAASGEDSNEDPISTIAGILNAHLSSLHWIDAYLRDMQGKVKDAERKIHEVVNRRGSDGLSKVRSFGLSSRR